MGNHVSLRESDFSRLPNMGSDVEKQMKTVILIASLSVKVECSAVIASVNTADEEAATWDYVSVILIEDQKRTQTKVRPMLTTTQGDHLK